jgi:hypothetical protein
MTSSYPAAIIAGIDGIIVVIVTVLVNRPSARSSSGQDGHGAPPVATASPASGGAPPSARSVDQPALTGAVASPKHSPTGRTTTITAATAADAARASSMQMQALRDELRAMIA